jgi:arylsulfatase A-like enzyme
MHDAERHDGGLGDRSAWIVILSASLTAGLLNMAFATLRHPEIHKEPLALLAFLSVNVAVATICQLAVWLMASTALLRLGLDRSALSFAIAVLFVAVASLWPLLESARPRGAAEGLAVRAVILSNALLSPLLAYQLAIRASARVRDLGFGLALSSPFIGGLTLALLWLQMYRIERITSPASLICTAMFGVAMLATLGLAVVLRERVRALPCLVTLTALVIGAPLIPAVVAVGGQSAVASSADASSPSVLLLTIDTLRADALDLGEAGESRTPALAGLAEESVVFEQARSAAPWTKASVASMLTGLSPLVHRATKIDSRLPDEIQTLAEYLRERGYKTTAIGRNSFLRENSNFDQGFEEYLFFPSSPGDSFGGRLLARLAPIHFGWSDPSSADLTETALGWIRANHDRPFLLWLHYFDPHMPYAPHASFLTGQKAPARVGRSFDDLRGVRSGHYVPSNEEQSWIRGLYDAEVRDVDANAARVLGLLRELGLYDRTLIAFTSDHGEEFWEHGGFEHGHDLYDEVIRVPLLFKVPGGGSTGRVTASVSIESLTATLLDVLGFSEGAGPFTSDSLAGYWKQGATPPDGTPQLTTGVLVYEEKISVIFDGLKYIRAEQTGREELFDLTADPRESVSVAASLPGPLSEARTLIDRHTEAAAQLRRSLDLPEDSTLEPDEEWMERLRALGYVQ